MAAPARTICAKPLTTSVWAVAAEKSSLSGENAARCGPKATSACQALSPVPAQAAPAPLARPMGK